MKLSDITMYTVYPQTDTIIKTTLKMVQIAPLLLSLVTGN